jgi:hypothetical protein
MPLSSIASSKSSCLPVELVDGQYLEAEVRALAIVRMQIR